MTAVAFRGRMVDDLIWEHADDPVDSYLTEAFYVVPDGDWIALTEDELVELTAELGGEAEEDWHEWMVGRAETMAEGMDR